jgi:uncharacterized protein YecE (DUF72 family)
MDTTFYVGTSGYGYKEWKGSFYPNDLPAKQMLRYYAERLDAVEMNNTFRRMPTSSALAAVAPEVPPEFQFAMKAPQQITHFRRLKNCREPVEELLAAAKALKKRLGPLLFQLPPNFKKDLPRLREFLKLLPKRTRAAFEFRHASWFDDEVFGLLRKRNVALCYAEEEESVEVPFVATADWGYLRLRLAEYGDADLKRWVKRVREQDWKDAFVFFKHEDEANGPRFAKRFLELAG